MPIILYHLVRLLFGKVLGFLALVVVVFLAAVAVRYVVTRGPELAAVVSEAQALEERRQDLELRLEVEQAAIDDSRAALDHRAAELEEEDEVRAAAERSRLQEIVEAAEQTAATRRADLEQVRRGLEPFVDAHLDDGLRELLSPCDSWWKKLACWWARGKVEEVRAELIQEGHEWMDEQAADACAAVEEAERQVRESKERMDAGLDEVRSRLSADAEAILAPLRAERERSLEQRASTEAEIEIMQAELDGLRTPQTRALLTLKREWDQVGRRVVLLVLLILAAPYLQRTAWYWLVAPLAERRPLIRLTGEHGGAVEVAGQGSTLRVKATRREPLLVRPDFVASHGGREGFRLLYDWRFPVVSYVAGMVMLNRYEAEDDGHAVVQVSDPGDQHPDLLAVRLREHPGIVLHPRHLVGVRGAISVRSVWRLTSWHAWATLQFRYLLFGGTGLLVLTGGGAIAGRLLADEDVRTKQDRVVGFDSRLGYSTRRTGSFFQYLLGRSELLEDRHCGSGILLTQTGPVRGEKQPPLEKALGAVLNAVGKLLGF